MPKHTHTQNEEWRDIPGHEGHYQASSHGRIRSLDRTITHSNGVRMPLKGKVLKQSTFQATGYPYVNLGKRERGGPRTVHSLVAEAFIGPRKQGMTVCHNDGSRTNNHANNLRYGSYSENNYDIVKHGRNEKKNRTHCPRGHELFVENIPPSILKRGRRQCLACVRARARVNYHKHLRPQLQQIADSYYETILDERKDAA